MTAKPALDDLWDTDAAPPAATSAKPSLDDLWEGDSSGSGEAARKSTASDKASAAPVSTWGDVARSTGQGIRVGAEAMAGLPEDFRQWSSGLVDKGMQKLGMITADQAANDPSKASLVPSTADIHAATVKAGIPDYDPQTRAGRFGKTVGEFIPSALMAPESLAVKVGKYALAPGLASEAAGQAVQGTPAEPWVRGAAGLVGGLGAEGLDQGLRAGLGAAKQVVEPLSASGQQNWAARNLQGMFSDPDAAKTALQTAKSVQQPGKALGENIPGAKPTTGQLTGDMGALSAEREMATRDPASFKSNDFGTGSDQQNAARTQALQGVQPTGSPEAVSQAVRDHLAQIEAQHDASNSAALQSAQQAASGIGSGLPPEAIGANLRDALQSGRDAAKANERGLWSAVDPDGTLVMPATPIAKAATNLAQTLPPTAKPMAGEEAAIFNTATSLPPAVPFQDVTALRSRISGAMREEMRSAGATPAYGRLAQLRGSVEDAISGAVTNKAASEAQAGAQTASAPVTPLESRVNDWLASFNANKNATSASGVGTSGGAAAGASRDSGVLRTAGQGNGGFGGNAGAQGVQSQALSNLDQAAATRLKAASAATKDNAQTFKQGPVGQILKTQGQARDYSLADAAVPAKMFAPGPSGAQTIAAYRKAAGPNGEAFLHDAAAQSLNREAMKDGVVDPVKYQAWAAKHQDALRALPNTLKAKFSNAASAGDALAQAAATRKAALEHYQTSATGKFLNLTNPQDVTRTVGGVFEAKDGVQRMSQLAERVKSNPDAQQGLRKAVLDHIMSKAQGTTEAGTSGISNLNAGRFQNLIRNNAQTIKAAGFSDKEVGLMRAIGEDMQRNQRTLGATRLAGQSNSPQDLLNNIERATKSHNMSLMGKMTAGALGGWGIGGVHAAAYGALSGLGEHIIQHARNAGIAKASTLVRDAMNNPELALALLERSPGKVGVGAHTNLKQTLMKMAAFTTATENRENQRKHRAAGGAVKKKSHEELVSRLMTASEQAKAATKKDTRALLSVPDNSIAKALAVAQRAI